MIEIKDLFRTLNKNNINFFTGVPDSVLKLFSNEIEKKNQSKHIVASNEGSAIALASGYFLAKKKIACVYMQNSGLGNAINPLASIAHSKVYSIPIFLIIGWRGSPEAGKDEPQHLVKGKITKNLLKLLGINSIVIRKKGDLKKIDKLIHSAKKFSKPVACLIENGILISKINKKAVTIKSSSEITRSYFIEQMLNIISAKSRIIATTGYTSRELNQMRKFTKKNRGKDFYMVGGMGHSSIVSLGYSLNSKKETICLDGDGSLLMHLGSLPMIGNFAKKNFKHILLNNRMHESVGGQKTISGKINFKKLSESTNYQNYFYIKRKKDIQKDLRKFFKKPGPSFLNVEIKKGSLKNLSRPKDFIKIKKNFSR